MPNWNSNHVMITASREDIKKIVDAITGEWLFKTFIPYQQEVLDDIELEKKYGYWNRDVLTDWEPRDWKEDGYTERPYKQLWRQREYDNWWTKRDFILNNIDELNWYYDEEDWSLDFFYDSAWWPHYKVRPIISEKCHAHITIEYEEPSMNFSWIMEYKNWEEIQDVQYEDAYFWHGKECPTCWVFCDDENEDDWLNEEHTRCIWCDEVLDTNNLQHED